MKPSISKEFLFEYFGGKASSMQKQLINNWVKDPANEDFFYQCLEEWERQHPQYLADVNRGITGFRETVRLNRQRPLPAKTNQVKSKNSNWLLAASVVLVLGLAGFAFEDRIQYSKYETSAGEVAAYTLPDGSLVTLNANSNLKVSRFWKILRKREVFLSGEAEFKVTRSEAAEKFIVKTGNNVDIQVVGTVFTVFNRHNRTEVLLNEGKVRLTQQTDSTSKTIEMVPGDKIRVDADQKLVLESGKVHEEVALWKEHRYQFDTTSLDEVAQILSDLYSLEVKFENPEIRQLTISGSFLAASAEELLESVCYANSLKFSKKDQTITFYEDK